MITFKDNKTIEGNPIITHHNAIIKIKCDLTSPVSMQMIFYSKNESVVRDIVQYKDFSVCKPMLPKEFITSNEPIQLRIIIFAPGELIQTNLITLEVDKEKYKLIEESKDPIKVFQQKIGELERLINLMSRTQYVPPLNLKSFGDPKAGMVFMALTDKIFGWSDLFKDVIVNINGLQTMDGKIELTGEDIPIRSGGASIGEIIVSLEKSFVKYNDMLDLIIKRIETYETKLNEHIDKQGLFKGETL